MNLNQIRGLLYYRLLKVMVIVGHNDIECCFLMPHDISRVTGILSDDYYRSLIEKHAPKVARRRQKVVKYLKDGFEVFQAACEKVINSGVMERLFRNFDFFSVDERELFRSPRRAKPEPKVVKLRSN